MEDRSSEEHDASDDSDSRDDSRDESGDASSEDDDAGSSDDDDHQSSEDARRVMQQKCTGGVETHSLGTTIDWSIPFPSIQSIQNTYDTEGKIVSDVFTLQNGERVRIVVMPRSGPKNKHVGVFVALEETPVDAIHSGSVLRTWKKKAKPFVMSALHIHIISSTFRGRARFQAAGRIWVYNMGRNYGFHGSKMLCTHEAIEADPERFIDDGKMKLRVFVLTPIQDVGARGAGVSNGVRGQGTLAARGDARGQALASLGERMYASLVSDARQGDMEFVMASTTTQRAEVPSESTLVLRAHSSVMATVSPVLAGVAAQITARGQNNSGGRIRITCPQGISEQAIHKFIKYLYVGGNLIDEIRRFSSLATQIFTLGDAFDIPPLIQMCEAAIKTTVNESNCCSMAVQAHKTGCKRMQELAIQFICENDAKVMSVRENMEIMREYPALALMMMDFKYQKKRKRDDDEDNGDDVSDEDESDGVGADDDELAGF
jgi:hypothetical protein